ncbi:MAG: hypothetical protein VCA40_13335 [Roseibacillus sp.]|nr:hypothetical protein [Deltaproteobacteria bacterium]
MITRSLVPLAIGCLLASCGESRNRQRAEVRQVFQKFSDAFFARDGRTASSHLSQQTFVYYDRVIPLARNEDDAGLSALPPLELFSCLALRHRYSPEELTGLDSRNLVLDSFDRMVFPAGAPHFLDIGEIRITTPGVEAIAPVFLPPGEWHEDILVTFRRENGEWKMDLTSVFDALDRRIEPHLLDSSSSRAERALYYLQIHENEQIGSELLRPRN